jgi:hypothetical protein
VPEDSSAMASSPAPQVEGFTVEGSTEGGMTLVLEMADEERGGDEGEGFGETGKTSTVLESSQSTYAYLPYQMTVSSHQ